MVNECIAMTNGYQQGRRETLEEIAKIAIKRNIGEHGDEECKLCGVNSVGMGMLTFSNGRLKHRSACPLSELDRVRV